MLTVWCLVFALAFALTGCDGTGSGASNNNNDIVNGGGGGAQPVWTPPSAGLWNAETRQRVTAVDVNDVEAAVAHANETSGRFILAIDQSYVATPGNHNLTAPNTDLTIIGIGGPREIRFINTADDQMLFSVGPAENGTDASIRLTLGNNITLVGRTEGRHGQANNTQPLVRARNGGRLYMLDGSKITGHTTSSHWGAVAVHEGGVFTMSGGTITGNASTQAATNAAGGFVIGSEGSRFYMTGGSIRENTRGTDTVVPSDVLAFAAVDYFTLSGDAAIYHLTLEAGISINSFITVGTGWSGSVDRLDLRSTTNPHLWAGRTVLQTAGGLTAANVEEWLNWSATAQIFNTRGNIYEIVIEDGGTLGVLRPCIIGTWEEPDDGWHFTFNADGTFTGYSWDGYMSGSWVRGEGRAFVLTWTWDDYAGEPPMPMSVFIGHQWLEFSMRSFTRQQP
jgi:hypothetical protein